MHHSKIVKWRKAIIEACDAHLQAGGTIIKGGFTTHQGCCPISCLMGAGAPDNVVVGSGGYLIAVNRKLGFDLLYGDFWSFIDGFDGIGRPRRTSAAYRLGKQMRRKYLGLK
jgi:hypothetical protein